MPIYIYECSTCKKTYDISQRMTDAHLTRCLVCKSTRFRRVITAPMVMTKSRTSRRKSLGSVGDFGPDG